MTTTTATAKTDGRTESAGSTPGAARGPRRPGRIRRIGLPYLLLLPALVLELLVHLVPMVMGILMSFKALTRVLHPGLGRRPLVRIRQLQDLGGLQRAGR